MNFDEDFGRNESFTPVDDEKQAKLDFGSEDDGEASDSLSHDGIDIADSNSVWPTSYRQSTDMLTCVTPPTLGFLVGSGLVRRTSSYISSNKKCKDSDVDVESSLADPLLVEPNLDKAKGITSTSKVPINELPVQRRRASFTQSLYNGINVLCGMALLSTPYAVKEGGWWSLVLLLLYAIVACYTGVLVKRCLETSPSLQTYPDMGQAACGIPGRLAVSIILYVELYGCCVEYLIMISDNLSRLFPNTSLNAAGVALDCHQIFAMLATIIVLPTVWLRDLSLLSYVSVGGVLSSILMVLCLVWVGVVNQVGFHPIGRPLDLAHLPVAIGIYGFGFSGHAVFPNIYTSMKEPSKFPLILVISFATCLCMYAGAAVCAYLMFGDSITSQFTLNMPQQFAASNVGAWAAILTPFSKYALTMMPVAMSLEELMPSKNLSYGLSILIRTILVFSTLVVAFKVPSFAALMALIGSLLSMLIAFIIPCVCYLSICRDKVTKFQIGVCVAIVLMAVVCACCGTYSAIASLAGNLV